MSKLLYTDLFEYSTDNDAQIAWVSDAGGSGGLPSSEYSVSDGIDIYTKLLLHMNGGDATTRFIDNANDDQDEDNCVLMLHFDGSDTATSTVDASLSNHSVTFVNNAQIDTAQKKFGSASVLMQGTNDYLTIPDSPDWHFGAGDFTVDTWIRYNTIGNNTIVDQFGASGFRSWRIFLDGSNDRFFVYWSENGSVFGNITLNLLATPSTNTWYHLAFVRSSGVMTLYQDGIEQDSVAYAYNLFNTTQELKIGSDGSFEVDGWIDDFRITKGTALWTTNFTPPTSSPSPKLVTVVNNAQIDTAENKFSTGSGLFDGIDDYLTLEDSEDWNFGTGNWTIDFWIRWTSAWQDGGFFDIYVDGTHYFTIGALGTRAIYCQLIDGSEEFAFYTNTNTEPPEDTWMHIAVVRYGTAQNNAYIFLDGVSQAITFANNLDASYSFPDFASEVRIGYAQSQGGYYRGWIDEVRVSKGIARWTEDFDVAIKDLQCYSEDTIKQQGSYSLKIEANTDTLNDTLTKTLTDYLDYSIMDVLKFEVRASRTGSNIKLKLHDIDGDTQEHTINIASADTWQTEIWDISGISATKRDQIDKFIIEIINADVANEIYIDNLFSKTIVETSHTWVG
ncbi:hypothetical protein LCGC14_0910280 [marine sediment metagenome]|uniref:LamG-like jellyroll fold domain-containing protein n=1 Tax=marine sediment metagenome TaxID=412755 RepID=A0A0F9S0N5_9ZZZZ